MSFKLDQKKLDDLLKDQRLLVLNEVLGQDLYLVGSSVRNLILGKEISDIDLATSLLPEEVIKRLNSSDIKVIPTGLQHQTVTALPVKGLSQVEITTLRTSGMRPTGGVHSSKSIDEDLLYRDFSINSIAISLNNKSIIDPLHGIVDLEKKIIRAHNPDERFLEDPLRILRMVRQSCQLGYDIDDETFKSALKNSTLLRNVSIERIRDELVKTILTEESKKGLRLFSKLNLFDWLIPELHDCINFEQNKFHKHDVFEHTLDVVELIPNEKILRLSALFHDIGKPPTLSVGEDGERHFYLHEKVGAEMVEEILPRLRFSNTETEAIKILVATHMRPLDCGDGGLRRIIRDTGEYYKEWRELKFSDTVAVLGKGDEVINQFKDFDFRINRVKNAEKPHPFSSLSISGQDLIELGLIPSRKFKDILGFLQEAVLDDPQINTKDKLLELVRDNFIV